MAHHAAHQAAAAAAAAAHQHQAAAAAAAAQHPLNQAAAAAAAMQALHASIAPQHLSSHGCASLTAAAAAAAAAASGPVGAATASGPGGHGGHGSTANMALSASLGCSMVGAGNGPNGNQVMGANGSAANLGGMGGGNSVMLMGGGCSSPCSTLFIANLGQFVVEQELKDLFSSFPGFCRLKMHSRGGAPVAFVEYTVRIYIFENQFKFVMSLLITSLINPHQGRSFSYSRNEFSTKLHAFF